MWDQVLSGEVIIECIGCMVGEGISNDDIGYSCLPVKSDKHIFNLN